MKAALLAVLTIAASMVAYAQEPGNQLSIGYELQRTHLTTLGLSTPSYSLNGLSFSNNVRIYKWLGAEGAFSIGDKSVSGVTVQNYYALGGPRVSYTFGRLTPYGHFLIGIDRLQDHTDNIGETALALGGGGGASVWLTRHFGVSGGVDYLHASKYGIGLNTFRVIAGPTFRWGGGSSPTERAAVPAATTPIAASVVREAPKTEPRATKAAPPQVKCLEVQIDSQGKATCTLWSESN